MPSLCPASHGDCGHVTRAEWTPRRLEKVRRRTSKTRCSHEVDARDTTVLIGFVHSESELGAALCDRIDGDILYITGSQVEHWRAALRPKLSEARVERWVRNELLRNRRVVKIHPRVN